MASDTPEPEVLVQHEGPLLHITLNRPRVINAFNRAMAETVTEAVTAAQVSATAPTTAATSAAQVILIDGAGERGFCGGGDIKAMSGGSLQDATDFLRAEYLADYRVATSRLPVVGIMDGITMGGGIGLTGHAAFRIVTERSRLAMPETKIGIAPDVGGHLLLARAPGRLGELLAITSGSMTAGDAIALGFADAFVPSSKLPALREALARGQRPEAAIFDVAEAAPESELVKARGWFDEIANDALGAGATAADSRPVDAANRLIAGLESSPSDAAQEAAAVVRTMCPVSVAVSLAQLARTRTEALGLAEVLADDLRVLTRLLARGDFAEGVRAQVIDKDGAPQWQPATIEDLDAEELAAILAPLAPHEEALQL